jgi:hypothetical protein
MRAAASAASMAAPPAQAGRLRAESGFRLLDECRPRRVVIGPGADRIAPRAISVLHTSLTLHCSGSVLCVATFAGLGGAALRRSNLAHLARIMASSSACCRFES